MCAYIFGRSVTENFKTRTEPSCLARHRAPIALVVATPAIF